MADQLTIVMSAEEARLWQSITSTVTKMAGMERGFAKITEEARKSARANQELERAAKGMLDSLQTPLDRHQAKLADVQRVYEAGKISVGQYSRIIRQLTEEYSRSSEAGRRAAAVEGELFHRRAQHVQRGAVAHQAWAVVAGGSLEKIERASGKTQSQLAAAAMAGQTAFGGAALGQLAAYAAGMISIGAVIGRVTAAYREWRQEMTEIASKSKEIVQGQMKMMARAGDWTPAVEAGLKAIPGALRAQKEQLFLGLATPEMTVDQKLAMTRAAVMAIPAVGGEDLENLGELMKHMTEYAPGRKPGQYAAMAVKARQMAEEHAPDLTSPSFKRAVHTLTEAGVTPERSMAMMITAMHLGQRRPDVLIKMAEAMTAKPEAGPIRTPEDLTKYQFYQLGREERYRALMEKPELARAILGEGEIKMRQIRPEVVAGRAKELLGAETEAERFLAGQAEAALGTPAGRKWARELGVQIEEEKAEAGLRPTAEPLEWSKREFRAATAKLPWFRRYATRLAYGVEEIGANVGLPWSEGEMKRLQSREAGPDRWSLQSAIDANTSALRENTAKTDSNTRGQRVGAAGAVNTHTENH